MKLKDRIALVTGVSRGIGRAVAKRFAAEGAHIIGIARNQKKLEEFDDELKESGYSATFSAFDLTEFDKIDALASHLANRFGRLDILVGNAGILGALSPVSHIEPKNFQAVMDTNFMANWRLIKAFDPLLKVSDEGRAIFVTSSVATSVLPYWGADAASKAALEIMVKTYAAENEINSLKVNMVDPGAVKTELRAIAFPGENQDKLPSPDNITDIFVKLASAELSETGKIFRV